jgi:DNA-binding XRE family transcriptional regulator
MTAKRPTPCRQVRQALGLTQQQFSTFLGIAKQTVVDIEGRRNAYQTKISWKLARKISLISGADPRSLIDQAGTAWVSAPESGGHDSYTKEHAQRWKSEVQDRNFAEDGPSPLIADALATTASALVAADKLGPMRASMLWDELLGAINLHRLPPSRRGEGSTNSPDPGGLPIRETMADQLRQFRKLRGCGPSDSLQALSPLTLMQLAEAEPGHRLLLLAGVIRAVSALAAPLLPASDAATLQNAVKSLRSEGLALLRSLQPATCKPTSTTKRHSREIAKSKGRRAPSAPKRRR